jgi:hypothetical protein
MSVPRWLYEARVDRFGGRTRRWGSRRPLGAVVTWIGGDEYMSDSWLAQVGRWCLSFGPAGGVSAGHASLPRGSRNRLWFVRGGRAIGLALVARKGGR